MDLWYIALLVWALLLIIFLVSLALCTIAPSLSNRVKDAMEAPVSILVWLCGFAMSIALPVGFATPFDLFPRNWDFRNDDGELTPISMTVSVWYSLAFVMFIIVLAAERIELSALTEKGSDAGISRHAIHRFSLQEKQIAVLKLVLHSPQTLTTIISDLKDELDLAVQPDEQEVISETIELATKLHEYILQQRPAPS